MQLNLLLSLKLVIMGLGIKDEDFLESRATSDEILRFNCLLWEKIKKSIERLLKR